MAVTNDSLVMEFILLGITEEPGLQVPLFFLFLVIYLITTLGNLALIILIVLNSHLHTPMYFFLFNLSLIDLCYSSVITPKMLMNFLLEKNVISYTGCMTQLYLFCFFGISEYYVLTAMAYDRYVAICNPLLYNISMSPKVCFYLILASYLTGLSDAMIHTGSMLQLTFCDRNTINHYFCDLLPLLQLSCSSTYVNEMELFIVSGKDIVVPTAIILTSYGFILHSIFQFYVLTSMAYDRYMAICNPLLYNVVMSPKLCLNLMFGSYFIAFSTAVAHTACLLRLTFCGENTINHYFCDIPPLLQLSCTSTYANDLIILVVGSIHVIVPTSTIFISYGFILFSIIHISSSEGRSKAFSTCSSHIIVVSLFFGSGTLVYFKPSTGSMNEGKISSVLYTNVVPMMNPLIYSLRNKDIKVALMNSLRSRYF
ncbi:Olfactory receptor 8B3 [Microtus ochrogaster]|uniref:Olfactory receptor 8B3 n=1 Tax=Microtus ochrogaster TaxID=79684 RepID=A0A8J6GTK0_MICOH|nr:Olfactory receptor 8B3 [Microtus ochrogaster]